MFNWVSAEAAALLVSLSFATRNIFVRAGQEYTTPLMSTFAITLITCVFLVPLILSEWSGSLINWMGVFWFTLAGVTAPGVALLLYFASISRIGVVGVLVPGQAAVGRLTQQSGESVPGVPARA